MAKFRWLFALALAIATLPTTLLAQERGTITGRVTDENGQPLAGAQVAVQGTELRAVTNAQGQYRLVNVPAGSRTLRVGQIGREAAERTVTVAAGETATANFALPAAALALEGLVVSATGQVQRRREVGNAVSNVNIEDVELAAVDNVSQLINGRAAGVIVQQSGGTTGTGARIRIRGSNSISLSNEPLLIIDGVRVDNNPTSNSVAIGGQTPSRLNDINSEDIESIEILKGPAASALYGTAAANGVIQITTKRGRSGQTRFRAYTEQGTQENRTDFPANFGRLGVRPNGSRTFRCSLDLISRGLCRPESDELLVFNPLEEASPFRDGYRQKYGVNLSGGGEQVTYYVSGDFEDEEGIYENNELQRANLRANFRANVTPQFNVSVSTGYVASDLLLPQNDNNLLGVVSGALLGFPFRTPDSFGFVRANTAGYVLVGPDLLNELVARQDIRRLTGSGTVNWLPAPWLNFVATAGLDEVNRFDTETLGGGVFPAIFSLDEGFRTGNRVQIGNYTGTVTGTATFDLTPSIVSSTSVGGQYLGERFEGVFASGARLLAGTRSLSGLSARFSINEVNTDVRTVGGFAQQQFSWEDRRFLTLALRGDDNSAFGADFGFVLYPSVSASWVITEEGFFPQTGFLGSLRLRAAYGESGLRPTFRQADTFFDPVTASVSDQDVPAFQVGGTGNLDLEPERSREIELGFDAGLFGDRANLEFTFYNKRSEDALVQRRLAPSVGLSQSQFVNLGEVRNTGAEVALRALVIDRPNFAWNVNVTASTNENELEDLGEGVEPIIFGLGGSSQRHQEGFPLGGYWGRRIERFNDDNGNGIIERGEVELSAEDEFIDSPIPTRQASFSTDLTLFRFAKLSGLLDYKGGYSLNNSTNFFRCASSFANCREAFDATAPLEDQARYIAGLQGARGQYVEDASFARLRELALTLNAPTGLARRFQAEGLSLTLAGRNLALWTDYTGLDPELNFAGQANFSTAEFLTQPPLRQFTARVEVTF
jgi:TonB-linked SusC/RagA family outer membrane protein